MFETLQISQFRQKILKIGFQIFYIMNLWIFTLQEIGYSQPGIDLVFATAWYLLQLYRSQQICRR